MCAVGPEKNSRPDVAPRYERIGTEQNRADNAPQGYCDPPKIVAGLSKNLAEGQEMESDHDSGQRRSQVWTVKDVSNRAQDSDCGKFQNDYDNKLFVDPLCRLV
jgi:hypothetical protein